jgi:sacsin
VRFAGVPQLVRSRFYREHVFPRVGELGASERDGAMLAVLHELHALSGEDGGFLRALRELAFVPVCSGALRCASELFHPRVSEAAELLDGAEVFPSGSFADAEVLSVLERLGMRNTITRSAVLQSARSVEALLAAGEPEKAKRLGKSLLRFIDANLESLPIEDLEVVGAPGLTPLANDSSFLTALGSTAWMPVVQAQPHPSLPWMPKQPAVAAPREMRPYSECWLISHSLSVLDGELSCEALLKSFEWDQPPRPGVVCAQLVQFAEQYDAGCAPEDTFLWRTLLLPAYAQLMGLIESPNFSAVAIMLQTRKCLWVGREHGFLSPEHLIFDPEKKFKAASPYLASVTSALEAFEPLLKALNVREAFRPEDFVHANTCFLRDAAEKPLSPEALTACVATLEAASTAVTEGEDKAAYSGYTFSMPNAQGVLRPASELTFDDAPWMSSTLRQRPDGGGVQFVHSSISAQLAESLGARSLRYLLLLEEKLTDTLPCPGMEGIKRALSDAGHEAHLLLDLLEVADSLGAHAVNFVLDGRSHPTQSLISPVLASFQNEALCMYMPGVKLTAEQVCKLQHPSGGGGKAGGARLLSMYFLSEVPCIVSGAAMYMFDPSGKYITSSVSAQADGGGGSSKTTGGIGRAYPLVPNDLPNRFPDQFAPLAHFGFRPSGGRPMDGTLIRLPLRSHLLAAHSTLSSQFWTIPRVRNLMHVLRKNSPTLLLGLDHVEALTAAEWQPGSASPATTLKVSIAMPPQEGSAQRGALARDTAWKSVSFFGMLSGKSTTKESHMLLDVNQIYRDHVHKPEEEPAPKSPQTSTAERTATAAQLVGETPLRQRAVSQPSPPSLGVRECRGTGRDGAQTNRSRGGSF